MEELDDVFTDGEASLKEMKCSPSVIELVPESKPITLSTTMNIGSDFRNNTKTQLDKMAWKVLSNQWETRPLNGVTRW